MTASVLEAMRAALAAATWTTKTPVAIHKGPLPMGGLGYPAIALMADAGNEAHLAPGISDTTEAISWTMADTLPVGDVEAAYIAMIQWRDEARATAIAAVDGCWGVAGIMSSEVTGWNTDLIEVPGPQGVAHLLIVTINLEVGYREQV